jgi:D-glycero-alpha-D-manno-heptose-7-phosphate kinase
LIVTRAPLRVSFIGGGTDYLPFIERFGGAVIATSIDKYVYVSLLELPTFAREGFRFTYRITESVSSVDELKHPSLRATLKDLGWIQPLNIATMADVPGSSGLGSSSAFVVALRQGLNEFSSTNSTPAELAEFAIKIERHILAEPGGVQDQYEAAFGGFRLYKFGAGQNMTDSSFIFPGYKDELHRYFTLVSLKTARVDDQHASNTAKTDTGILKEMLDATLAFASDLESSKSIQQAANILSRAISTDWSLKQRFSPGIANPEALEIMNKAMARGAKSAKVCGAGGAGFVLLAHEAEDATQIRELYPVGYSMAVKFTTAGSEVIYR